LQKRKCEVKETASRTIEIRHRVQQKLECVTNTSNVLLVKC